MKLLMFVNFIFIISRVNSLIVQHNWGKLNTLADNLPHKPRHSSPVYYRLSDLSNRENMQEVTLKILCGDWRLWLEFRILDTEIHKV